MCQPFPAPCFGASDTVGRTGSRKRARGSLQSSCSRQQLFVVQSNFIFTHSSLTSLLLLLSHPCVEEEQSPLPTIQHHQSLKVLSPHLPAACPSAGTSVSHIFGLQCSVNRKESESQLIPCLAEDTHGKAAFRVEVDQVFKVPSRVSEQILHAWGTLSPSKHLLGSERKGKLLRNCNCFFFFFSSCLFCFCLGDGKNAQSLALSGKAELFACFCRCSVKAFCETGRGKAAKPSDLSAMHAG